jgi:hypothetical protein
MRQGKRLPSLADPSDNPAALQADLKVRLYGFLLRY